MHEPAPSAADVPGYNVGGRAPAFPALTEVVLSRFRRLRLPLEPDVSARKFHPDQEEVSLLCDFWQFEENALATLDPGHTPSQLQLHFGMSGTNSSVTPVLFAQLSCGPLLTSFQCTVLTTW